MKDETKRAQSFEGNGRTRKTIDPLGEKRKRWRKKIFPGLAVIQSEREGEDSSWRRRGLWW